jgi:hemerythrin
MDKLDLHRFQSVNNDVIDEHHEKIIEFFNALYENTDQLNSEIFEEIVDELINYTRYHFATEEQYMSEIEYDDIKGHIQEHRTFAEKLQELKDTTNLADEDKYKELIVNLGTWVINHETEKDIDLVRSMNMGK